MDTNIFSGKAEGVLGIQYEDREGIMKTVTTVVELDSSEDGCEDGAEEYQVKARRLTGDFSSTETISPGASISQ